MADQAGYTRLPNDIIEAMPRLGNAELRTLLAIARKTIGFQKESDRISVSQIAKITGLTSRNAQSALTSLLNKGLIERSPANKQGYTYSIKTISLGDTVANHIPTDTISLGDTAPYPVGTRLEAEPYPLGITQKKDLNKDLNKESVARVARTPRTPKQGSLDSLHEACQIAKDTIGKKLTPGQATTIASTVIDLEHWRAVVTSWGNRYGTMNVDGMIDWYLHPDKMRRNGDRSNGHGKQPIRQGTRRDFERANWKEGSIDDAI